MTTDVESQPVDSARKLVAKHMEHVANLLAAYADNPDQFSPIMREFLANNMASIGTWLLADADELRYPPLPT